MTLLGRSAELAMVTSRLTDRRLVTVVGPAGIGKTTLARAAATAVTDRFAEGVRTVDLTLVEDGAGVRESLASQLGAPSFRALLEAPADRPVLVVVDSCEHVVEEAADALAALLEACEMPTVLATSRMPLELAQEAVIPLGPLELPPPGRTTGPAVALFLARAADAGATLDASEAVAELCRRLDGVPLGIELAAARTRSLTPEEVLGRLAEGLDVLDRPRRRSARRHQSLRAAIDWSYQLLDPDEQDAIARLSVCSGPFGLDLAHAVAGAAGSGPAATSDRLDALVAASMVVATRDGAATRYRLLEAVRAVAGEHLDRRGDRREVEARFVDHVVAVASDVVARGAGTWAPDALADLLAAYGDITAAVRWCLANDEAPDRALLLTAVLWGVVHQAHTEEVGRLAEQVLERWPDGTHPLRADATATAATCRYMLGDHAVAIARAGAALGAAAASPFAPATLRRAIAQARRASGDAAGSLAAFADAASHARRLGLPAMATEADAARAQVLADLGRCDEAADAIGRARAEADAAGSEVSATWAAVIEGSILLRSDPASAGAALDAALGRARRIGYEAAESVALRALALAALGAGDHRSAAVRAVELLDGLLARGSTYELRLVLDVAAPLLERCGRWRPARDLAATALALPVVSITASAGHELFPLDASGGVVLAVRDAIGVVRSELDALVAAVRDEPPAAAVATGTTAATPGGVGPPTGTFRPSGDVWELAFDGRSVVVRTSKGMGDLAVLLGAPGREVHCLDLVGGGVDERGTGEALDATARHAYQQRVRDLQQDVDDAEADHDRARAERARAELDALVDQLTAALGLGGRPRTSGSSAERARSTVTQRVRAAIRRIEDVHPPLGRHLRASVRTGTFCAYDPEHPVDWEV